MGTWIFLFVCFWDIFFLLCLSGYLATCHEDQASFQFIEFCLPLSLELHSGIKGLCHHAGYRRRSFVNFRDDIITKSRIHHPCTFKLSNFSISIENKTTTTQFCFPLPAREHQKSLYSWVLNLSVCFSLCYRIPVISYCIFKSLSTQIHFFLVIILTYLSPSLLCWIYFQLLCLASTVYIYATISNYLIKILSPRHGSLRNSSLGSMNSPFKLWLPLLPSLLRQHSCKLAALFGGGGWRPPDIPLCLGDV